MGQRACVHAKPGSCAGEHAERAEVLDDYSRLILLLATDFAVSCKYHRDCGEAVALVQAQTSVN